MKNNASYHSIFSITLFLGVFFLLFSQCYSINENSDSPIQSLNDLDKKQKGAHVFGYLDSLNLQGFKQNNIEWITLVPYGDQKDFDSPIVNYYRGDSLRMIRRDSFWNAKIDLAHALGFKVFLKPHVWLGNPSNGKWRSDIFPLNENNWKLWQKSYREFILMYAKMAEKNEVELFCIGTEFTRLSLEKSDFWEALIRDVRSIYSGKITYAANWHNEFEKITFWDDLDYIGVQAYFPLAKNKNPNVQEISKGWNKHISALKSIHKKYNRKILFTEMGYKSTDDSAIKPWEWIDYSSKQNKIISIETQANCYEAFFNTVWKKKWFAGVHIWQMRSDYGATGRDSLDFTPQGKAAENIIAKGFE